MFDRMLFFVKTQWFGYSRELEHYEIIFIAKALRLNLSRVILWSKEDHVAIGKAIKIAEKQYTTNWKLWLRAGTSVSPFFTVQFSTTN
tara:strand:+ start:88 stop:351 length:264 start_codon:yes stop_codon:yes gene_type:complete